MPDIRCVRKCMIQCLFPTLPYMFSVCVEPHLHISKGFICPSIEWNIKYMLILLEEEVPLVVHIRDLHNALVSQKGALAVWSTCVLCFISA